MAEKPILVDAGGSTITLQTVSTTLVELLRTYGDFYWRLHPMQELAIVNLTEIKITNVVHVSLAGDSALYYPVNKLCGFPIVQDSTMPENEIELRRDTEVIAKIQNLGQVEVLDG